MTKNLFSHSPAPSDGAQPRDSPKSSGGKFRRRLLLSFVRLWWLWLVAAALVALAYVVHTAKEHPPIQLEVKRDTRIDVTPEEVRSIRDIGQWEFLAVSTEELVEWSRSRTFSTDRLVRIYSGTLRLGIDLRKAPADWFTSLPDSTASLHLPPVELLDSNFIDEARTRSFYEKGICPPKALDDLYARARQQMLHRCLTPQNLKQAENNARQQFTKLFEAMGFRQVILTFGEPTKTKTKAKM